MSDRAPRTLLRRSKRFRLLAASALLVPVVAGCRSLFPSDVPDGPEALPVRKVPEEIVVAAWADPSRLPPGGGQVQIVVRVQKRGGAPYPGVEVRLATSAGGLYSRGRILVTDNRGMTRDRLTSRREAFVTLNAGGTRYSFRVPLGEEPS